MATDIGAGQDATVNFDGIPGPTHNYAGLARGNLAAERHAREIAQEHRPPRPEARDQGAARDAEERHRENLRREHDAHACRRVARLEHEPRERHERHRGAGARDDLGDDERGKRAVPHGWIK